MKCFRSYALSVLKIFPCLHAGHLFCSTLAKRLRFLTGCSAHMVIELLMNKFFSEFFRRNTLIVPEEPCKVRVVFKIKLIGYFKNTHSCTGQQTFGFQQYSFPDHV